MKKYIKLTALLISALLLLCSCSDNDISSNTSSDISDNTENNYAIRHEKVVSEGMSLTELCEKGILPDLSSFGINYKDFQYDKSIEEKILNNAGWTGEHENCPIDIRYQYQKHEEKKDNSKKWWKQEIKIDESGRLRSLVSDCYSDEYSHYIKNIPGEKVLSKEQCIEIADNLANILAENGKQNLAEYKRETKYNDNSTLSVNYLKPTNYDGTKEHISIEMLPDGEITRIKTSYKDISPNFTSVEFDDKIDTMMDEYITARHGNAKEEQYEYSFGSGTFQAVNGKIYGAYTYTIAFYNDEYPDDPAYGCYSIYFEEP